MAKKPMGKSNRTGNRRVPFQVSAAPGSKVFLAGTFNDWKPAKELKEKDGNGIFTGVMMLQPGRYEYKVVVNDEWRLDENNPNFTPNDLGTLNSVLVVEELI